MRFIVIFAVLMVILSPLSKGQSLEEYNRQRAHQLEMSEPHFHSCEREHLGKHFKKCSLGALKYLTREFFWVKDQNGKVLGHHSHPVPISCGYHEIWEKPGGGYTTKLGAMTFELDKDGQELGTEKCIVVHPDEKRLGSWFQMFQKIRISPGG